MDVKGQDIIEVGRIFFTEIENYLNNNFKKK